MVHGKFQVLRKMGCNIELSFLSFEAITSVERCVAQIAKDFVVVFFDKNHL